MPQEKQRNSSAAASLRRRRDRLYEKTSTRPINLPECIPSSAADAFFKAAPHIQKLMIIDADQPNRIYRGQAPRLRSAKKLAAEGTVCFCKDLHFCPLTACSTPGDDHPEFDGMTYQYYPTDDGWWNMREAVLQLGKVAEAGPPPL